MNERDELAKVIAEADGSGHFLRNGRLFAYGSLTDAVLAAGYRKPRTITTAEELDALPVGSVVHSEKYIHHANGMQISFQRWDDGLWHRGARSSDTHPSNFLPATVLWEPR